MNIKNLNNKIKQDNIKVKEIINNWKNTGLKIRN